MAEQLLIDGAYIREDPEVLWNAVKNGSLKIVEGLLKDVADINTIHNSYWRGGMTLLHFAAHEGQVEMAKLLLKYGANVNVKNNAGATPIFFAVRNGNTEMTEQLLINGADIKDEYQTLCIAVKNRNLKIVKDLLKYGGDANVIDNSHWCGPITLLHIAVSGGQVEMVKLLLKYGASVSGKDSHGNTPLVYALENKDRRMMDLLFTNRASIKGNPKILWTAVNNGYVKIVRKLLKDGADANMIDKSHWFGGMTLLHCAAHQGQVKIARLLLTYGANIDGKNTEGDTPILLAIRNEDRKMIRLLLICGADIKGNPKIQYTAIEKGNRKIVKDLLQFGTDANMKDDSALYGGMSLLHIAVIGKHVNIAKLLLNYGANVNVKNNMRESPILFAIVYRDRRMIQLLLNNGADIREDPHILWKAVQHGSLIIVENLLKDGAVINTIDNSYLYWYGGMTLLQLAVRERQEEMAKLLLKYGAKVNVKDMSGRTLMDDAIYIGENGYTEMVELLLINGADTKDVNIHCLPADSRTAEILKHHVAKLKAAGLNVIERNLLWIRNDYKMDNFLKQCKAEIQDMKKKMVGNSCVSFYDILRKRRSRLGNYESVVLALKSGAYKKTFPIYASMIDNRFTKDVEREELLEQVRKQLLHTRVVNLPPVCLKKIFSYLSDKDLRFLLSNS